MTEREDDHDPADAGARFTEGDKIAQGGMGVILRLRDHALGRDLAKKRLLDEAAHRGDLKQRLKEEARLTAQLDHPGVVPLHDIGLESDGRFYFTMKLVEGRTFEEIIDDIHTGAEEWTLVRGLNVLLRVCETLAFAHSRRVVHRDLKPENVMVGDFGEVYVMDWGVAKVRGSAEVPAPFTETTSADISVGAGGTVIGTVIGTPGYMPPEQASGDVAFIDERSDIYAIGAMLYHLVASERPYRAVAETKGSAAVVIATHRGPPEPLDIVAPQASSELCAIAAKAMARDPAHRYQDTEALRRDLEAFLEGRVVGAHRTGLLPELQKWIARNRAVAGLIALTVLLVTVGSLAFGVLALKSESAIGKERNKERAARRRAEGLRIAALADSEVDRNPGLALALGLEGAARAPGTYTNSMLHRALQTLRERRTLTGHGGYVYESHFSPDGTRLLSVGERPALLLWNTEGGGAPLRFDAPAGGVSTARFSPDGGRVAAAFHDGHVRTFDASTGQLEHDLAPNAGRVHDVRWSPDGSRLAAACADGHVFVWAHTGGAPRTTIAAHHDDVRAIAWHPDGSLILSRGDDSGVCLSDAATGALVGRFGTRPRRTGPVIGKMRGVVGWLAGGDQVVSWAPLSPCQIWDAESHRELASFADPDEQAFEPGWNAAGDRLVIPIRGDSNARDQSMLVVWDVRARKEVWRAVNRGAWRVARFSEDGSKVVAATRRVAIHEAAVFDAQTGRREALLRGHAYFVHDVAMRQDGLVATASADGTVRLWRSQANGHVSFPPGRHVIAITRDGRRAIIGYAPLPHAAAPLDIVELDTRRVLSTLKGHGGSVARGRLALGDTVLVGWVPGAQRIHAIRLSDGHVLWRAPPPAPPLFPPFEPRVTTSPDGTRITLSDGTAIRVLDARTGDVQLSMDHPAGGLGKLSWSPDGRLLLGAMGAARGAQVWSARTGTVVGTLGGAHEGWVTYATASYDGTMFATAGSDETVVLWNAATLRPTHRFVGLPRGDLSVAFSPDDAHLFVMSDRVPLTVFELSTRTRVAEVPRRGLLIPLFVDGSATAICSNRADTYRVPTDVVAAATKARTRYLAPGERLKFRVDEGRARAPLAAGLLARLHEPQMVAELALDALTTGRPADAEACADRIATLEAEGADTAAGLVLRAARAALAGDAEAALVTLQEAANRHADPELVRRAAIFAPLRGDPRWPGLLKQMRANASRWR